jgi:hypothetical protein
MVYCHSRSEKFLTDKGISVAPPGRKSSTSVSHLPYSAPKSQPFRARRAEEEVGESDEDQENESTEEKNSESE